MIDTDITDEAKELIAKLGFGPFAGISANMLQTDARLLRCTEALD